MISKPQSGSPTLADFDFELPPALIAQFPLPARTSSRLLHVCDGQLHDRSFTDLPALLRAGDLLVLNDTRVLKARLFGHKASGGRLELLVERLLSDRELLAQVRASHMPKPGSRIRLGDGTIEAEVLEREDGFCRLRLLGSESAEAVLEQHGSLPLPPYIDRGAQEVDHARYQTVYAREAGAVAAPTAGLHFDYAMLDRLEQMGVNRAWVTLHVGAGTFLPVRDDDLARHRMHEERYNVPQATADAVQRTHVAGGRVIAVGTTSLRALESASSGRALRAGAGSTDLFILPGYRFQTVDTLLTNFHLPRSTLLMLVSAFAGMQTIRAAYTHAIAQRYRFFSYGDAMLLEQGAR